MLELRITGNTTAELVQSAGELIVLLANGAKVGAMVAAQKSQPAAPQPDLFPASDKVGAETIAEPMENPKATDDVDVKPKRGRKPKPEPEVVEADAETGATHASPPEATIEQVKDCVRQALENAAKRAEATIPNFKTLKGKALDDANQQVILHKINYVKPLLQKFGANKVTELAPEQYGEFVAAAQAYIDGEA